MRNFTAKYFHRIGINHTISRPDSLQLVRLHKAHVLHVPFENLDIQYGIQISLQKDKLFKKIVTNCRGGFCYELNYMFHLLLTQLGFRSRIISAQILNSDLELGPQFDHMALLVEFESTKYLADVGFGDLFIAPLELEYGVIQNDMHHSFILRKDSESDLIQLIKLDRKNEAQKLHVYSFELTDRSIDAFTEQCNWKQTNPNSYFVKNKICTLPNPLGRKTILNDRFIQKIMGTKTIEIIKSFERENQILKKDFGIVDV